MLFTIIQSILIFLGIFYALLYFYQENLLFYPQRFSADARDQILKKYPAVTEISFTASDGVKLHGWLYKPVKAKVVPLVIYFGGNTEEVSSWLYSNANFGDWAWAFVNYRGYGLSEGSPGQKNFFSDALLIYDTFKKRPDINPDKIVAMGRSLGSGVAVYLAANRPVKGLILISPYDSVVQVAQKKFPFVPIRLLIKHPFESISYAQSVKAPVMSFIAEEDTVIPMHHSLKLMNAFAEPKRSMQFKNQGHNTVVQDTQFWPEVRKFLDFLT